MQIYNDCLLCDEFLEILRLQSKEILQALLYNIKVKIRKMGTNQMGQFKEANLTPEQKIKLQLGKPIHICDGIKITKNPKTGKLEGVPQEWAKNYDLPVSIDYNKLVKTQKLPENIRADSQLPASIIELINAQPVEIEWPSNLEQNVEMEMVSKKKQKKKQTVMQLNDSIESEDLISSYEYEMKQSMIESQILTTKEFQYIIDKIKFIEQNPGERYVFERQLGKGAMCKVFFCYDKLQENRNYYACRIIKLKDQRTIKKIKTEVAVMSMCSGTNLTEYFFTHYYKESLFMFVQFMDGGAMTDIVYHYMKKIPEDVIAYFMKEMLKGLQALHQKKQLHRDLKSDNVLLSLKGDVKIADFGFAIQLTKGQLNRKSVVGTPAWMAPQLIKKEGYDQKVDIWSLGMIAMELCQGEPPFLRLKHADAMRNIVQKDPPVLSNKFSSQLRDFVSSCLKKNPKQRWSATELLNHNFIQQIKTGEKQRQRVIKMLKDMKKASLQSIIKTVKD